MQDAAWQIVADRLTLLLTTAVLGDTLVLTKDARFVQFAHVGDQLHFETVSNQLLPPDRQLTTEDQRWMTDQGWRPPDPPDRLNHTYDVPVPASADQIRDAVDLVGRTLRELHGVSAPAELAVRARQDESGIPLPFAVPGTPAAEVAVIDAEAAAALLTTLRNLRWSWRAAQLPAIASELGWADFEIVEGDRSIGAYAHAAIRFGGDEVDVEGRDGNVDTILIRVSDRPAKDSAESVLFLTDAWLSLVAVATRLFGPPTIIRTHRDSPDAHWRGEESTIRIVRTTRSIVFDWSRTAYQDHWNTMPDSTE